MGIPRLFKLPTHRKFNYVPRYYDEDKEEREKRYNRIKAEVENDSDPIKKNDSEYSPRIKGKMQGYFHRPEKVKKQSNIRLLIILAALSGLAYYILFH